MKRFDFEDFISIALSVIIGFFYGIWKLICWVFSSIGKFIVDVLKNVYGRIVIIVGGAVVLIIIANLTGLFHK